MDEEHFTRTFVLPFLRKLGYQRIRYVHGADEHGRDVVFFDKDRFGLPIVCAAQVKAGSISGSQKKKIQTEIVPQLLEGIRTPYKDIETGEIYRVQRMYLIISGSFVGTAKEQIHSLTSSEPNVVAVDVQSIDALSSGDGYVSFVLFTKKGSNISYPSGIKFRPKLPLMHKGITLDITMDLGECGYADIVEIVDVSYNPILREQTLTIELPLNEGVDASEDVLEMARACLDEWFDTIGAFLSELIEYELLDR